ncbi:MAG: 1-deoxy-D-xylulose-5-phosphate synthase [Bacteroidales bacterium]|nr:1-deoxy-D-xylulose-5-phosphate synthase [Bacteroidales bacterium]
MVGEEYRLLKNIDSPADLRLLDVADLPELCDDVRRFIIDVVSTNPGHFGASLGVVELATALHYSYNTPTDKLIWDVGHQAYPHKILTGRRDRFHTNRKINGISGFPNMSESEYDAFGVGHSSTSISAALGIAIANKIKGDSSKVIAVIGDGALTGGMAFEGLNHAGIAKSDILVVLNDNNMAIDPNVGALKEYLLDITTSKTYNRFKDEVWNVLGVMNKMGPNYQRMAQKFEKAVKSTLLKRSNLFEALNFRYFGPVDGHDSIYLARVLKDMQSIKGPKLLHVITKKGKGYKPAEDNQTVFHAPGLFNKETGERLKSTSDVVKPPKYQDVFGKTLVELAKLDESVVGITPAMPSGCSMTYMMEEFPERSFDVGIAEQHAVTFAAGLATKGIKPFCNIYSTFMQRAFDQVIHDVALQKLNVVFCLDRGGLVGEDGATHHGVFDIAYMRMIPGMVVSAPINEEQLRNLMYTGLKYNNGPFTIRYPRGEGVMPEWQTPMNVIPVGKGEKVKDGDSIAVLTIGHPGNFVKKAISLLSEEMQSKVAHYNMIFVKPIDEDILKEVGAKFKNVVTVENGTVVGGFGSAVTDFFNDNNYNVKVKKLGVPDRWIEHGTPEELHKICGFDAESIFEVLKDMIG